MKSIWISKLKMKITKAIRSIDNMQGIVMNDVRMRCRERINHKGRHLNDVIFNTFTID